MWPAVFPFDLVFYEGFESISEGYAEPEVAPEVGPEVTDRESMTACITHETTMMEYELS